MKSSPLEGPGEAHGSILLDDIGVGLFAFGTFPRLHGSVGPRIHTLNPRQTSEDSTIAGWLVDGKVPTLPPSLGPLQLVRPMLNCEVPDGRSGPFLCEVTTSRVSVTLMCQWGSGANLPYGCLRSHSRKREGNIPP